MYLGCTNKEHNSNIKFSTFFKSTIKDIPFLLNKKDYCDYVFQDNIIGIRNGKFKIINQNEES